MDKAQHFAEGVMRVAERLDDAARLFGGHWALGGSHLLQGKLEHPFFPPSVFAWDGMIDRLEVQVLYPAQWRGRGPLTLPRANSSPARFTSSCFQPLIIVG
jgi:hypothetical protein